MSCLAKAKQALSAVEIKHQQLQQQLSTLTLSEQEAQSNWHKQLTESVFADEQSFLQALMPEQEAKQLSEIQQRIQQTQSKLQALIEQTKQQLEQLEKQQQPQQEREQLSQQLAEQQHALEQVQHQLIKVQHELEQDDKLRNQQQHLLDDIASKKLALDDLAHLNSLIGSADGNKFRKFAQGLTLAHLVYLANQQLSYLDGRYQLQCHQQEELALQVLDTCRVIRCVIPKHYLVVKAF